MRRDYSFVARIKRTFKATGHAAGTHDAGNLDDLVKGDVAVVLDILNLLSVTWRLLQGLDDQRRGRRDNLDGCLTILDDQLAGDLQTLPVGGCLGDIITDLLGRQTEGTDLGSKGRSGTYLTADSSEVHCAKGALVAGNIRRRQENRYVPILTSVGSNLGGIL